MKLRFSYGVGYLIPAFCGKVPLQPHFMRMLLGVVLKRPQKSALSELLGSKSFHWCGEMRFRPPLLPSFVAHLCARERLLPCQFEIAKSNSTTWLAPNSFSAKMS